jgi:hypothetical protein
MLSLDLNNSDVIENIKNKIESIFLRILILGYYHKLLIEFAR